MAYIDKDIVLKTITDVMSDCKIIHKHRALNRNIKQLSSIEVPDVVHCKDCKHLMFSDFYGECSRGYMGIVQPDDFCSRGERIANTTDEKSNDIICNIQLTPRKPTSTTSVIEDKHCGF